MCVLLIVVPTVLYTAVYLLFIQSLKHALTKRVDKIVIWVVWGERGIQRLWWVVNARRR